MTFRTSSLAVGDRVRLRDTFLDEECTRPVTGTIADVFSYPDYRHGTDVFVVMFDHDDPGLPPGGEFSANRLAPAA